MPVGVVQEQRLAGLGLENALAQGQFSTVANTNLAQNITANESVTAVIQFQQVTAPPPGDEAYSLGSGVSAYHFQATATASSMREGTAGNQTDRDAGAVHTQTFYIIGPASPTL